MNPDGDEGLNVFSGQGGCRPPAALPPKKEAAEPTRQSVGALPRFKNLPRHCVIAG